MSFSIEYNYSESKIILEQLVTLQSDANRFSKLCFSDDGKQVGIETASSIYRTTISTANYTADLVSKTAQNLGLSSFTIPPTGWNREIQNLIPITQGIAELFTTHNLNQHDASVAIDLLAGARAGLKVLRENHYKEDSQKTNIINTARNALKGARDSLIKNYNSSNEALLKINQTLHEENTFLRSENTKLHEENNRLHEEIARLCKELIKTPLLEENVLPQNEILSEDDFESFATKLSIIQKKFGEYKKYLNDTQYQ